jgi:hypothetical protein
MTAHLHEKMKEIAISESSSSCIYSGLQESPGQVVEKGSQEVFIDMKTSNQDESNSPNNNNIPAPQPQRNNKPGGCGAYQALYIALRLGMIYPPIMKPAEMEQFQEPNFCPYHCHRGHGLEQCRSFKSEIRKLHAQGLWTIPLNFMKINMRRRSSPRARLQLHTCRVICRHPILSGTYLNGWI